MPEPEDINLEDKIKIIENANFREKTEKNKLVYNTYKNRVGIVKEIKPTNRNSITYIIEMTGKNDNTFSFDILEKYIQRYEDIEFLINENVRIKKDANLILEEERSDIFTELSGEVFFQNIKVAENLDGDNAIKKIKLKIK